MTVLILVFFVIFALSNIACFFMGAKIAKGEPIIQAIMDEEMVEPPDYTGNINEEE